MRIDQPRGAYLFPEPELGGGGGALGASEVARGSAVVAEVVLTADGAGANLHNATIAIGSPVSYSAMAPTTPKRR